MHIWKIEANAGGKWVPLVFAALGFPATALTRYEARKLAKQMFYKNEYNKPFINGLSKVPACRYRAVRYNRCQ